MAFRWRWLLVLLALAWSGGRALASGSTKEASAYAVAVSAFQDEMWGRAEMEFDQFVKKYPDSTNAPQAVLLLAQADFKQGKYTDAIAWLIAHKAGAGNLADQYAYWIGEAEYQNQDYASSLATFTAFAKNFPDSPLRLRATIEAASSYAQLKKWPQVIELLEATNGVFQQAVREDATRVLVSRGRLLLAQAKGIQKDFNGEFDVLSSLDPKILEPELNWQREYLLYQNRLAVGKLEAALAATTNLLQIARLEGSNEAAAESVAANAEMLEQMGRAGEAMTAYQQNLTNAPVNLQRQAILKIAELALAQKQFTNAEQSLQNFLAQFTNSSAADVAKLTLGELYLKNYVAQPTVATNGLQLASATFDQFLATYTNSAYLGKAYLDRGWCFWIMRQYPESFADFKMAAEKLPPSPDLAVARFKMGDTLLKRGNYAGALTNYQAVLDDFKNFPAVGRALDEQVLYQSLRANLDLNDEPGANATLARILKNYPEGDLSDNAILLVAEAAANAHHPDVARALLLRFERQFPHSELLPQAQMAVARTFGEQQNWPAAITNYENWLQKFPTNALQPKVDYALALANYQAGNETNAFSLFTHFVEEFPTNNLAPQAQWWIADHLFAASKWVDAETNYETIFQNTNWQDSPLVYPAEMMAGRAAMARNGYSDASRYFMDLIGKTNCPPDLNAQTRFIYGGMLMQENSTDTNNPLANFQAATNVFSQICQLFPTNTFGVRAWGEMGNCDLQLGDYVSATNAYAQVFDSPYAGVASRSQAQIGYGIALEKLALQATGAAKTNLLNQARNNYLDVFDTSLGKNLRPGEVADPFWVKKAGLQALPLVESLGVAPAEKFLERMEKMFPQLKESLEKKRVALSSSGN